MSRYQGKIQKMQVVLFGGIYSYFGCDVCLSFFVLYIGRYKGDTSNNSVCVVAG